MTGFEKWSVWVSSALVFITGMVYLWMKYWLPAPDAFSVIHHPLQPLVLKLHIVTAPLLVFALGSIALRHVWRHYTSRTRQGRFSGVGTAVIIVPMVLTGYLIQVITGETTLRAIVLAHIVTGVAFGLALMVHQVVVWRKGGSLGDRIAKGDRRHRQRTRRTAHR